MMKCHLSSSEAAGPAFCGVGASGLAGASAVVVGVAVDSSVGPWATADMLSSKLNVTPADTAKNTFRYKSITRLLGGEVLNNLDARQSLLQLTRASAATALRVRSMTSPVYPKLRNIRLSRGDVTWRKLLDN